MAVGHGAILSADELDALPGERWLPGREGIADGLRVPMPGTLADLTTRHQRFLARLGPEGLSPPPPLTAYRTVAYRRASDPPSHPSVSFSLMKLDGRGFRPFDPVRHTLTVARMMRRAVESAAAISAGWSEREIAEFVLGHREARDSATHIPVPEPRFAYLPLPSIERRGGDSVVVGSARRVMPATFAEGFSEKLDWARRVMPGQDLLDSDHQPVALLTQLPDREPMVRHYLQPASTWSTVTPVVLPGYDDPDHYRRRLQQGAAGADQQKTLLARLSQRIDGLLRKSIIQAGFSTLLAARAELEWRITGFWPGLDRADRYTVPEYLKRFPRLHVRLIWRDSEGRPLKVPGPICLGGGRFYGLGLFAGENLDA